MKTKEVTIKVPSPLFIPFAISHFEDEHGHSFPTAIFEKQISGFHITAKFNETEWITRNHRLGQFESKIEINGIKILDIYHTSPEVRIFCEDNNMPSDLWLKSILEISTNKKTIEQALKNEFETD
jgi:hypothetical protein